MKVMVQMGSKRVGGGVQMTWMLVGRKKHNYFELHDTHTYISMTNLHWWENNSCHNNVELIELSDWILNALARNLICFADCTFLSQSWLWYLSPDSRNMIFLQFGPSCLGPSCKTSLSCKLASCNQLLVELTQKMPKPFSHQDCREKVCCCCGLRTVKKKKVSEAEELLVRKYAKPEFDSNLREQPCGLCSTCRWYLYACKREERWDDIGRQDPRLRWDAFHLEHSRFREKDHDSDICHVCLLAKWNPVDNPEKRDLMRPTEEMCPEERQKVYKFCTDCYQHIGKGISHKCTSANAKRNLANIVMNLARNMAKEYGSFH